MQFVINNSYLIPLLPLLGAIVAGFFGDRFLKGRAHWPIWIGVGCSFLLSFVLLVGMIAATHGDDPHRYQQSHDVYTWISAGTFTASAGFYFDPLSAVMLNVVTGVGLLITIFAAGYMKGESGYSRFFAYLGLFVFAMTCLVMGNNLVMLYLGWEGVGLCSYLLIGYYYERPAASAAAKKAFIVNRVGDFGFAVGIMLCFWAFGTVTYFSSNGTGLLEMAGSVWHHGQISEALLTPMGHSQVLALGLIPFCLMLGAFGKSAQFPLYVWLPDAMEGPTPVSALIHAATMVTAGVYMIARCGTLFVSNKAALVTIAAVGAFTALFAATIALRQFDLKKVFAYSTVSQLGYMFVAVGVLAPTAAVFHLVTHAFFKALLFLSSGVVMHAMLGHLDMRKLSGLKHQLPKTRWVILIGCLALAGCPLTSGFFSKDQIVAYAFAHSVWLGGVLLFTSFLTAYYTFRLYFQVFEGPELVPTTPADDSHATPAGHGTSTAPEWAEARAAHEAARRSPVAVAKSGVDKGAAHGHGHDDHHHDHEPRVMLWPLYVLAVGALVMGFFGGSLTTFLGHSPSFQLAFNMSREAFDWSGGAHVEPKAFGQLGEASYNGQEVSEWGMLLLGTVAFALGLTLAYMLHLRDRRDAERLAAGLQPLTGLLEGKYWVDEIYDVLIVRPLATVGKWFFEIDRVIVDTVVWLITMVPQLGGAALKLTVQRGYLQGYAAAMFFGVLAILLLVFI
jgi:NADH-quinone oxidoreductase subunit L